MDATDLRVFEAVARLGGMSRAAAELNTVQSNVTARIRRLEGELGTRFSSATAAASPSRPPGGACCLMPCRCGSCSRRRGARRGRRQAKGPLTVGSLETTAALRLSPVLSAYARPGPRSTWC